MMLSNDLLTKPINKPSVVVFGFKTNLIKDIEKRMLRDLIIRKLFNKKYATIPIMQLETYLEGYSEKKRNAFSNKQIKFLAHKIKIDYVITGWLNPNYQSRKNEKIRWKKNYICKIQFYNTKQKAFTQKTFKLKGKKNIYDFFEIVSNEVVKTFIKYQESSN